METCSSGIKAYVTGSRFFQHLAAGGSIGALLDKAPILQYIKNVSQALILHLFAKRQELQAGCEM